MNSIVFAKGLLGDKSYAVQIRPVFPGGQTGDWGPTFSLIKRAIDSAPILYPIISSPVGIRISWAGSLNTAFDEQWLVKKFDAPVTEANFDAGGTEVFRGSTNTNVDVDLSQEKVVYIGAVKIDRYGNRSNVVTQSLTFPEPSPPTQLELQNFSGGFRVRFTTQQPSNANKYHVIKVIDGQPFTAHSVINKFKSGSTCSLIVSGPSPSTGDIAQIAIGDARFDGIFKIETVIGSSVTYNHTISGSVTSSASGGYIIPTSAGPSHEGTEVYRSEINSSSMAISEFEYAPQLSGQKIYIAVGTEDAYKNRIAWTITSGAGLFSYGRNFIAERDNITQTNIPNKSTDGYWKYGYIGWKAAHSTSTQELNTAATAGAIKIDTVTADDPDSIRLGVVNGTSTAMEFATDPSSVKTNSQSRYYPDFINTTTVISDETLSKPLIDDPYFVSNEDVASNKRRSDIWWDLHPSAPGNPVGLGKIWAECSASDIINDSNNTKHPIRMNGVTSIVGSFEANLSAWGTVNDNPTSKLSMYAVIGDWSSARPGGLYDPHFYPLIATEENAGRAIIKANSVTNKSKSSTTCTLTLATATIYPDVGELITVTIGDANFDGAYAVTTRSSNVITYVTTSSSTVSSAATTGSVVVNSSRSFTVTNKQRTGSACTITTTNALEIAVGDYIDVRIADLAFDGENFVVTAVNIGSKTITYTNSGSSTVASTAIAGNDKRVINRDTPPDVTVVVVDEWTINKNPDLGLYNTSGNPIPKKFNWSFTVPAGTQAESIRFAWVIEFEEEHYNQSRSISGVTSSAWAINTSYLIKLNKFEAWPSADAFAGTGSSNEFSDTQYLKNGLDVIGDAYISGDTAIGGDLYVDKTGYFNGGVTADSLATFGDVNVGGKLFTAQGDLGITSGNIYFWGDDYPITSATGPYGSAGNEKTINSIRAATDFPSDTPNYFFVVQWTGSFSRSNTDAWVFRLYRWNDSTGTWNKIREVPAGASGADIGASMIHYSSIAVSVTPAVEFLVTLQRVSGSGTFNTGYSGGSPPNEKNRLQVFAFPMSTEKQNTRKALAAHLSIPPGNAYDTDTDSGNTSNPAKKTKSATFVMSSGWKNSYKGTGATNGFTGGDINQGYFSSLNGNQKSAWGFNGNWNVNGNALDKTKFVAGSAKVISCKLTLSPTHWYSNGGTAIIGTHNDSSTSAVSNWGNINGKTSDRRRESFRDTSKKTFEIGTALGKEFWNGHIRSHLSGSDPGGWPASASISGAGSAQGVLFGPGPTNGSQYYGSFAPSSLKMEVKVEWKET